ncbi:hypothetical protein ACE193_18375 [Bernardetia sp. OM2101]|uniref:hypothetical protein n=1 Tax=Bernardetia sp. OM2101 TaxID=3344876 RepID=UPI0035CF8FF5
MNTATKSRIPNNKLRVPCRYKLVLYFNEQEQNNEGAFVDKKRALYAQYYDHDSQKVLAYFKDFVDKIIKNPIQYKVKYGTTLKTAIIVDRVENTTIWKHTVPKSNPTYFPQVSATSEAYEEPKEEFASEQEIKIALDQIEECYISNGMEITDTEYEKVRAEFERCNSEFLESMLNFRLKMVHHIANPKQ